MCTHLDCPRQEEQAQLPHSVQTSESLFRTRVPPLAAKPSTLSRLEFVSDMFGSPRRDVKGSRRFLRCARPDLRSAAPRSGPCPAATRVCRTATRCVSRCDKGVSHCDTGCVTLRQGRVALRHGVCHAATRACHAATRGVSRCDTGVSHRDTGCVTLRHSERDRGSASRQVVLQSTLTALNVETVSTAPTR